MITASSAFARGFVQALIPAMLLCACGGGGGNQLAPALGPGGSPTATPRPGTPTPSPSATPTAGPTINPNDQISRPPLTQSDFQYLGAFAPPRYAAGWSTGFAVGGLALRHVNGELHFFATTHVYSGGLVYEMKFPGLGPSGSWPTAPIVTEWGDIYLGHKTTLDNSSGALSAGAITHNLFWDEAQQRLYWSYGHWYDTVNGNPTLGYSSFMLDSSLQPIIAAHGPWGVGDTSGSGLNYKAFEGGALRIPQWFANRFTGGKTLALGFGGYYNIIAGGSLGPALGAIADPVDGQPNVDVITLLGHPVDKRWPRGLPTTCRRSIIHR